jgi:CubicO group peptidase (beta-lactamase class C family)
LVQLGRLSLDEPVSAYIKEWRTPGLSHVTIRHLLTHTSGLPAWFPLYTKAANQDEVLAQISKLGLVYETGSQVEYSCLGFIVLGILIERVSGLTLSTACKELVFSPLGMKETTYLPLQTLKVDPERLVLNEAESLVEKSMTKRAGFSFSNWREGYGAGTPNDGNACYAMKGISGNAGLFSTARDLLVFGQAWLNSLSGGNKDFLSPSLAWTAVTNHTPGLNSARGLGWMVFRDAFISQEEMSLSPSMIPYLTPPPYLTPSPRSSGELLSKQAFGHTGFTGTSLWIDPEKDLVMTLLTNRLHTKTKMDLNTIRARFHNAVVTDLGL